MLIEPAVFLGFFSLWVLDQLVSLLRSMRELNEMIREMDLARARYNRALAERLAAGG